MTTLQDDFVQTYEVEESAKDEDEASTDLESKLLSSIESPSTSSNDEESNSMEKQQQNKNSSKEAKSCEQHGDNAVSNNKADTYNINSLNLPIECRHVRKFITD